MDKTRQASSCCIFGNIEDLKDNIFPTYKEVMKFYNFTRYHLKLETDTRKEPAISEIAEIVVVRIERIWQKASIPTVSHTRIIQLLKAYHSKCKNLIKSWKRLSDDKKEEFRTVGNRLFDICSCKCKDFLQCKCPKETRVPKEEQCFLMDQRCARRMIIGGVDSAATKTMEKRSTRDQKLKLYYNTMKNKETHKVEHTPGSPIISDESEGNVTDYSLQPCSSSMPQVTKKKPIVSLPTLSKTCDRYGVSDRAAAAIASAVLHDIKSDVNVIDKSKLRREQAKARTQMLAKHRLLNIPGLYFDGRKDRTSKIVKKGAKKYRQIIVEEHISVIKEPDSVYVGYAVPSRDGQEHRTCYLWAPFFSKRFFKKHSSSWLRWHSDKHRKIWRCYTTIRKTFKSPSTMDHMSLTYE